MIGERHEEVRRREMLLVGVLVLIFAVGVLLGFRGERHLSIEARQRVAVSADLLSGHSRGRQALVGSLDYPPLPTIALTLLGLVPGVGSVPEAARLLGAGAVVFLALYVYRTWRQAGIGRGMTVPGLIVLILMPDVMRSMIEGTSVVVGLAVLVPAMGFLAAWVRRRGLHDLAFAAVLFGLAVAVYYQSVLALLFGLFYVIAKSVATPRRYMVQASVIVFALPALYVIGLWFAGNWLIMGDPLFHVKHWLGRTAGYPAPRWVVMLSAFPWQAFALVSALTMLPWVLPRPGESPVARRAYKASLVVLVLLLAAAGRSLPPTRPLHYVSEEIRTLTRRLPSRYRNEAFIVVGYDGYEFLKAVRPEEREIWIHLMHLDPARLQDVITDYGGRRILLILPSTSTAEYVSDIDLDLRPAKPEVPETLLLLERSEHWLIFECLPGRVRGV